MGGQREIRAATRSSARSFCARVWFGWFSMKIVGVLVFFLSLRRERYRGVLFFSASEPYSMKIRVKCLETKKKRNRREDGYHSWGFGSPVPICLSSSPSVRRASEVRSESRFAASSKSDLDAIFLKSRADNFRRKHSASCWASIDEKRALRDFGPQTVTLFREQSDD